MKKSKKLYTVQQAAKILGVTPKSVWSWINEGRIKAESEYFKGKGWGRDCLRISHTELQREKSAVAKCLWCKKVIKSAKNRLARKYCDPHHMYLYKKSIGYYEKKG